MAKTLSLIRQIGTVSAAPCAQRSFNNSDPFNLHVEDTSCFMVALERYLMRGQKRHQSSIDETQSVKPPQKRARKEFSLRQRAKTTFWDSLSRVHLTTRALKELDRRNHSHTSRRTTTTEIQRVWPQYITRQIKRFARHGGPNLTDLRGFPEPGKERSTAHVMPPSQSTSRTQTKSTSTLSESTAKTSTAKTKKASPYDPNFEQHLIDHGVYPDDYDFPDDREPQRPSNEEEILNGLAQPRPSLSPSQFSKTSFLDFKKINSRALSEDRIMRTAYPILAGNTKIPSEEGKLLTSWEPLTDGTLTTPKPDAYDGANPARIKWQIREQLGSHIIPSTQQHGPASPNFFIAAKGPDGSAAVARRQACYDGALGARGMHSLQNFGREKSEAVYDNHAYTITSTYHDGHLKLYTTHPTEPLDANSSPDYHMTQLRSFAITDTAERFREGAGAFRNARDWAKEQRDTYIAAANAKVSGGQVESTSGSSSGSRPFLSSQEADGDSLKHPSMKLP
ncbi:MAG: hypothetical protein M1816_003323 [Peltula sp. TS41687]|nr:MAG: hypothetical protein M1816_003323 [Peltula sp. TS41687]